MYNFKYKLKEQPFKVGDIKTTSKFKSQITDIDPETGKISWDINYIPDIGKIFEDFSQLRKDFQKLNKTINDETINSIINNINKEFNRYRTHIRKNYPEYYEKYQTNENVEEISISSGAGNYLSKNAFSQHPQKYYYKLGYKLVPKKIKNSKIEVKKLFQ
jgi:hypothetical protein